MAKNSRRSIKSSNQFLSGNTNLKKMEDSIKKNEELKNNFKKQIEEITETIEKLERLRGQEILTDKEINTRVAKQKLLKLEVYEKNVKL